jgi:hypothetical protein
MPNSGLTFWPKKRINFCPRKKKRSFKEGIGLFFLFRKRNTVPIPGKGKLPNLCEELIVFFQPGICFLARLFHVSN